MSLSLSTAKAAFQAGRFAEAESNCREVLAQEPSNREALMLLAGLFDRSNRSEQAGRLLQQLLEQDPRFPEGRLAYASWLHARGRFADAIQQCRAAMDLMPASSVPHYQMGLCYLGSGDNHKAVTSLEAATRLAPKGAPAFHFLGVSLQRLQQGKRATGAFREAIRLDPQAALSYAELGHLLQGVGDMEGAVTCFRQVSELQPNSPKGLIFLAKALVEEEKLEEAREVLTRSIGINPKLPEARVLLARILQQQGHFERARVELQQAIDLDPDSPDGYFALVNGQKIGESDRPLIAKLEKVLTSSWSPTMDLRLVEYALGKGYDDLKEYATAMSHYEAANRLAQDRLNALGRKFDAAKLEATVDRTIQRFTREFLKSVQVQGDSSDRPVFIVGMARSGTTLLEQMVSSHPDVAAAGELGSWGGLETFLSHEQPPASVLRDLAQSLLMRLERVSASAKRVTVKTPQNYMTLGQIVGLFPHCRIVHCRRNPIDTCLSIYTTPFHAGPDFAHDKANLVLAYRQYQRVMEHWRKVLPPQNIIEIDYEELVSTPEPVLRRIIDFLNLEWSEACLRHEANPHAISTPSVWQARQPVSRNSIARWKRYEPWIGKLRDLLPQK